VFQDPAQNPDWQEGNYEPKLGYGSLEQFQDAEVIILMPEGEASSQEMTVAQTGWFGRRFFYLLIPTIAEEVVETYLEQNTTPFFEGNSAAGEWQVRSMARDICLDMTFGLGTAWGICDFFGEMIDQIVNYVREYYQEW
jgi:hypothetical protein